MITRSTPPSGLHMTRFTRIAKRSCGRANLTVISRDNVGEIYLLFSIILAMISPRSTVTKLLAACLLICSVWMFAACVLLCSAHHESANASEALLSAEYVNTLPDDECCPIGQSPAGVLTERQSLLTHIDGGAQTLFASAIITVGEWTCESAHQSIPPPTSDPPLERLCTLRI